MKPEDSANFDGETLTGVNFYETPQRHTETFKLVKCEPAGADYWTAFDGQTIPFKVVSGQTCIATVQGLISKSGCRTNYMDIYVIWKPKTCTPGIWQKWSKKWSGRTAIPQPVSLLVSPL